MSSPVFKKRVIIVGAGLCGLVALKEMREAGHDAHILERSSTLGDVFAGAAVYPNLHALSNWSMAFSDFPDPRRLCYSSAEEYPAYLRSYARHFGLEDRITYFSDVQNASLDEDGCWSLQVRQSLPVDRPGQEKELRLSADALVVATGANQVAKEVPEGLSGFQGRVLHSGEYNEAFKREVRDNKLRVLVVGGGESGADIAAELEDLSPHVTAWLRRGTWVGPWYLNRASEVDQIAKNKTSDVPVNTFLESTTTARMGAGLNTLSYGAFRKLLFLGFCRLLNSTLCRMGLQSTQKAFDVSDLATYVTKNQRLCEALEQKKIEVLVSPSVTSMGTSCRFVASGEKCQERQFDAIVLCHGYRTAFSWLSAHLDEPPAVVPPLFPARPGALPLLCEVRQTTPGWHPGSGRDVVSIYRLDSPGRKGVAREVRPVGAARRGSCARLFLSEPRLAHTDGLQRFLRKRGATNRL